MQILRLLVELPGEVISRDDIRRRLWADNIVVEFDHSINAAVRRVQDHRGSRTMERRPNRGERSR